MGTELTILWVLSWILTLKFLQLSLWPHLEKTFRTYAYPVSFTASALLFTILTWYSGYARIPPFLTLLPFLILLAWNLKNRVYRWEMLRENLVWDVLFITGFLFVLMIRVVDPSISSAEKFMDHAFLASIMRNPVVSPLDPWFSGGTLSVYYYLGYWLFGGLGIVISVPSIVVFNLALPTVLGLTLVNAYLLGHLLLDRLRWFPIVAIFLVNPSFFYQIMTGNFSSVLWESTRTISNTINEYPLFSFLWGDVHPHIMGLFNQVFLLALLVFTYRSWHGLTNGPRITLAFLIALSLGSMPLINTWDVLIYGPIVLLFGVLIWHQGRGERAPFSFLFLVPVTAVLLYLPYYLVLEASGIKGIALVPASSDLMQFLLVHGFFLLILYILLRKDIFTRPILLLLVVPFFLATGLYAALSAVIPLVYLLARRRVSPEEILAMAGLVVIIIPEIIYLQDAFGDPYYRMNTVFKFYFAGWVLLGTGSLTLLARSMRDRLPDPLPLLRYGLPLVLILLILSPLSMGINHPAGGGTLDGMAFLDYSHPDDASAITYLRSLPDEMRIVEAENGDYTYFSRVSTFTGIPAVIGWPYHEITWRGHGVGIMERVADVRAIYENPDRSLALMDMYGASHLYVGDLERERYRVLLPREGLTPVYQQGNVTIYERTK